MTARRDASKMPAGSLPIKMPLFSIYVTSLLASMVQGLVLLLIPLYVLDSGSASWLGAGALMSLKNAGTLLVNIPAGLALVRFGDKLMMAAGLLLMLLACAGFALLHGFLALTLCMLLFGIGAGIWTLARLSFMSVNNAPEQRGRTLALLAGVQRTGMFIGPLGGGMLVQAYGFQTTFLLAAGLVVGGLLLILPEGNVTLDRAGGNRSRGVLRHLLPTLSQHRSFFLSAGAFVTALRLVRSGRQLLLPLWGYAIDLEIAQIGVAFALSALADVMVMYLGGAIADLHGRKWSAGLCLGILSLSLLSLPWCDNYSAFLLLALFAGVGNGLGGGIIMTLGADMAPPRHRGIFLGVWRLLGDVSGTVSPVTIGWIAGLSTLGTASTIAGALGVLGLVAMKVQMRETLPASRAPDS
ncbi:MAG: MFS transporter [Pseudohongiellaceae bacterium]